MESNAIHDVLVAYATALDSKQYDQLSDVFLEDATAHYVGVGDCHGLSQIVTLVSSVLDQCAGTQHLLGNFRIQVNGSEATAQCYLQAIHVGKGDFAESMMTVWGEYSDKLVLTANGWRIAHRELRSIHGQGDIGLVV
jgi:3-phenylpropionate/cinnamic acid dioxygenase small subunit